MRINGFYLFLLLFLVTVVLTSIYYPLRYLKYFIPLVPVVFFTREHGLKINRHILNYYLTFLVFYIIVIVYLFLQNAFFFELSDRFMPNAVFILAPLLFVIFMLPFFNREKVTQYVKAIFFINATIFLFEEGRDLISVLINPSILRSAILSSELSTENHLAFVFGFFVLFFLVEKADKWYLILAIVLFVLCFKRIVIAAVIVSAVMYWLISFLRINIPRYRRLWLIVGVLINLAYVAIAHLIVSGSFDALVYEKTGFSTDRFLMGRKTFYTEVFREAGAGSLEGLGLGKVDDIIYGYWGGPMNLHSEILKNYFEFGLLLFLIWLVLLFYKNLFSTKATIFFLYLNILMLTDNVFIYFDIMFYFYFFILIFLTQKYIPNPQANDNVELSH